MLRAPQEGSRARTQLPGPEGFDQIVVCADLESLYEMVLVAESGKDEDGRFALAADGSDYVDAVNFRHHQIQDDDIGSLRLERADGYLAVERHEHFVPFALEGVAEQIHEIAIVVNHENSHIVTQKVF